MLRAYFIKTIAMVFASAMSLITVVNADTSREYQLKAAYLLNFARFIYWPGDSFDSENDKFNICVYGSSSFDESLNLLLDKKVQGRSIQVDFIDRLKGISACHILFVSGDEAEKFYEFKMQMPKHVLSVSDKEGFSESGGMIEFVRIRNKIKFEINVTQSTNAGIKYKSQLLEVAERLR